MTTAKIEEGRLLRGLRRDGKVDASLSDWAVLSVVEQPVRQIGTVHLQRSHHHRTRI